MDRDTTLLFIRNIITSNIYFNNNITIKTGIALNVVTWNFLSNRFNYHKTLSFFNNKLQGKNTLG